MASSKKQSKGILKSKPTQNDLRRLMKEKQQTLKSSEKKIISPLAKYNNLDQLICVLCNAHVKSEKLWLAHVNGRAHKDNLEDLRKKKEDEGKFRKPAVPPLSSDKRKSINSKSDEPNTKKQKQLEESSPTSDLPADFFDGSSRVHIDEPSTSSQRESSSSDDDSDVDENNDINNATSTTAEPNANESTSNTDPSKAVSNESIPEGFFDDPIIDAKVRKVEYKDPAEEEWEKFQKEIANVTAKSQVLIDEEDAESKAERQIDEIDEQINNWARVNALQKKKEQLATKMNEDNSDGDADVDEQEFDEILNWRSKGVWR